MVDFEKLLDDLQQVDTSKLTARELSQFNSFVAKVKRQEDDVMCVHNKPNIKLGTGKPRKTICVPGYGHIFKTKLRDCHVLSLKLNEFVPENDVDIENAFRRLEGKPPIKNTTDMLRDNQLQAYEKRIVELESIVRTLETKISDIQSMGGF